MQNFSASTEAEEATWDQLAETTTEALERDRFAVQDGFMGAEWADLVAEDVQRIISTTDAQGKAVDKMQKIPIPPEAETDSDYGDMMWLDVTAASLAEDYPALGELLTNLQALPHELNLKQKDSQQPLNLKKLPNPPIMLMRLRPGCSQPPRVDHGVGGQTTGYRLSLMYFVPRGNGGGKAKAEQAGAEDEDQPRVVLRRVEGGTQVEGDAQRIHVRPDRLVLWDSKGVAMERLPDEAHTQIHVSYWIHGDGE